MTLRCLECGTIVVLSDKFCPQCRTLLHGNDVGGNARFNAYVCVDDITGLIALDHLGSGTGGAGSYLNGEQIWTSGTTGPTGDPGATGDIGPQGEIGLTGDTGLTGDLGMTGDPGDPGATGDPGTTGDPGDPGGPMDVTTVLDITYTVTSNDDVIVCNCASGTTIYLPDATGTGKMYYIKNINSANATVECQGADVIDNGITSISLGQWESLRVVDSAACQWLKL